MGREHPSPIPLPLDEEEADYMIDPRSRFEDPDMLYSTDNMQVSDYLNIEEREQTVAQAWDLYHLNAESDPTSSNPFWMESWNRIAIGIKSDQRYLRRLHRLKNRGYNFDEMPEEDQLIGNDDEEEEEYDVNSDLDSSVEEDADEVLPQWVPNLREKSGRIDLLMLFVFLCFFSIICGLQHCEMFRKNYCNVWQCFYQNKMVQLQTIIYPTPGSIDPCDTPFDSILIPET